MAYDKIVDSTQLEADLTTVANAIRTKGGTSAALSFPNGMAAAIAAIPSGTPLPSPISKIDGGSFTPSEVVSTEQYYVYHNLGEAPKGFLIWTDGLDTMEIPDVRLVYMILYVFTELQDTSGTQYYGWSTDWMRVNSTGRPTSASVTYKESTAPKLSDYVDSEKFRNHRPSDYYKANCTYHWLAWA